MYTCCPFYINHRSIGLLTTNSYEEIWNSETAQEFRKRILNGDYSLCNLQKCCEYAVLPEIPNEEIAMKYSPIMTEYPKYITFAYDQICNAKCGMCRDKILDNDQELINKLNKLFDEQLLPLCKSANKIFLSCSGEVFYSKHSRYAISRITKLYPDICFDIISNGFLCNEENIKNLGLLGKIDTLVLSIHAATKNTHKKIMRAGSFDIIQKNLISIKKLHDEGKIKKVNLVFIVSSLNYKEMPAFAKMAKKLGMVAVFCEYVKRDRTEMGEKAEEYSVHLKSHPKHIEFLKILKNKYLAPSSFCQLNPLIENLRNEAISNSKNIFEMIFGKK